MSAEGLRPATPSQTRRSLASLRAGQEKWQTPETPNVLGIWLLGRVCEDLAERGIDTLIVHGNHDPLDAASVYRSPVFESEKPGHVVVLDTEDPVEAVLAGVTQTQVNVPAGLTYATALRSLLRQDPEVVMVGEVRDRETAEIAVQASLTGHLVLSTLHTNTAAGAVTRLRDMGVEPFLLSSSLLGVLAQRLVRVLDDETNIPYTAREYECQIL